MFNEIINSFASAQATTQKVMPLNAILITANGAIQTETEATVRITNGHMVRVQDGAIVNVSEGFPATHEITGCFGNISNTVLYFEARSLIMGKTETININ